MPIINGRNDAIVTYFPLDEYVERIKLKPDLLAHLEDTNNNFKEYIRKIMQHDDEYVMDYWIYLLYEELRFSHKLENMNFQNIDLVDDKIFFGIASANHSRIHELHNFVMGEEVEPTFEYRTCEVDVSDKDEETGEKIIFWRGAQAQDIEKFMNDFLKIYKRVDISALMSNPFLKSALVHLLFLRIHPYGDENEPLVKNATYPQNAYKLGFSN